MLNKIKALTEEFLMDDKNFINVEIVGDNIVVLFKDINDGDYHTTLFPYVESRVDYPLQFMYGDGHTFLLF